MNTFKKILLSSVMTISIVTMSFTAAAVEKVSHEDVKSAIDNTLAKVEEANTGLANGTDNEKLIDMVTDARQLQKDISNNILDLKRNQASTVLKKARTALLNNDMEAAKESLADAVKRYKTIQDLYASNH
ncbi:hypothetical protein [Methylobacter sp. S3L5C]|uniref:hypothetical protein n=1 Tax=Methylobacter sp. S3L5C TaxID=2839024 RepID=UPI001FAD9B88|nr:hypothetical protein [Methylobacter sp. S3L5C]UOA09833.1 hypothetical protein KKZ03_06105 [Methylobacter sp. S3L5C]